MTFSAIDAANKVIPMRAINATYKIYNWNIILEYRDIYVDSHHLS